MYDWARIGCTALLPREHQPVLAAQNISLNKCRGPQMNEALECEGCMAAEAEDVCAKSLARSVTAGWTLSCEV